MSFLEFAKMMRGKDPKAIVDSLCASGRMTETQKQQLYQQAQANVDSFRNFLK